MTILKFFNTINSWIILHNYFITNEVLLCEPMKINNIPVTNIYKGSERQYFHIHETLGPWFYKWFFQRSYHIGTGWNRRSPLHKWSRENFLMLCKCAVNIHWFSMAVMFNNYRISRLGNVGKSIVFLMNNLQFPFDYIVNVTIIEFWWIGFATILLFHCKRLNNWSVITRSLMTLSLQCQKQITFICCALKITVEKLFFR